MAKSYIAHVISHTHWDREWYLPFQSIRMRLVHLVDKLLGLLESAPNYKYYLLDGQTIVVEDYLEIRPEARERLRQQVSSGRVTIGPWYILPDEFLVSGEATVRNLLLGRKIMSDFGGNAAVGYLPDCFGHLSQIPQILRGFGIESAVVWRGLSTRPERERSEWIWQSPDGSEVLLLHLPESGGYGNICGVTHDLAQARKIVGDAIKQLQRIATTPHLLLMDGIDHQEPREYLPEFIKEYNRAFRDTRVVHNSLGQFMSELAAAVDRRKLQRVVGELRSINVNALRWWNFLLFGVLSTRMYIKQQNFAIQAELERWSEPFSCFAGPSGVPYPGAFLWTAWKWLMQCHPHDSICGCSVDEVHRQMMTRFEWAGEIARNVSQQALHGIADGIDTSAAKEDELPVVVFNPSPFERAGLIEVAVNVPGSRLVNRVRLVDEDRNPVDAKLDAVEPSIYTLNQLDRGGRIEQGHTYYVSFVSSIPAYGHRVFYASSANELPPLRGSQMASPREAENEHLNVTVNDNGTLTITDKATGRVYRDGLYFEDSGDVGDEYTYSPPVADQVITTLGGCPQISVVCDSPFKTTWRIVHELALPSGARGDRKGRASTMLVNRIETEVTLGAGRRRVDCVTRVWNSAHDHRFRVVFPTHIESDVSVALGQFDVVTRPIRPMQEPEDGWIEDAPQQHPHQGWFGVSDGKAGAVVAARGLPEFEVANRADRALCLTLLRCVGSLAVPDGLTRRGCAGPFVPTPDAQCVGEHQFEFAFIPHSARWAAGGVGREAEEVLLPLRAIAAEAHKGDLAPKHSFLSIYPAAALVSAIKKAEDRDGVILRLFNPNSQKITETVAVAGKLKAAYQVRLDETREGQLEVQKGSTVKIDLPAGRIVSIELVRET